MMNKPIAGSSIAEQAWRIYSGMWDAYRAGEATLHDVRRARIEYDRAQRAVEMAAGDDVRGVSAARRALTL